MKRAKQLKSTSPQFRLRPFSRALLRSWRRLQKAHLVRQAGWGAFAAVPGLALAGPTGEQIAAGNVNVARPNANATHINQSSQNAIVNWSTFSIGSDEFVLIQQPNSSSTILNRVIGSQQSTILGQLQANGRVFLVNPQGVYVGPNASIDVGALTMSALDIKNEDFLNGNYVFNGQPQNGSIENAGTITTSDGGFVVLAGDYVNNTGIITATLGTVVLAAGEQVTLDIDNDGLVGFAVDQATVADLAGVENVGDIIADGGRVVMTASVANDLVATAVNNEGLVQAHRIEEQGGEIFLAGYGADVIHSGTLDVAGENGAGGRAVVYSDNNITLENGSRIVATGSGQNSGGTVRVIANGDLNFKRDAEIDARDGGFVEVSGHEGLIVRGQVNVGRGGTYLIDPAVLTITNTSNSPSGSGSYGSSYGGSGSCVTDACVGKGYIEGQLDGGANVILVADTEITSSGGPFTISAMGSSEGGSVAGDLTIQNGVTAGAFDCSNFGVCDPGDTVIGQPTGDINLSDVNINTNGNFTVSAGSTSGNVNIGSIRAANVSITAGSANGNVNIGPTTATGSGSLLALGSGSAGITAASTDLAITALGGNITIAGNVVLTGDSITDVDIKANPVSGTLNINGNVVSSASTGTAIVRLEAGNVNVNGNVRALGVSSANLLTSANNNININGTAESKASSGRAIVRVEGGGTVRVGRAVAEGTSGDVRLRGGNLTFGAVDVVGTSFAALEAFGNNSLTANGNINIFEAGGGFAEARFGGNGVVRINGGVNVNAGPGGFASAIFDGSEGTAINNLVINNQVTANGAAGDAIFVNVINSARTTGPGRLRADTVQVSTNGSSPLIDLDTATPQLFVDVYGGAPNILINNSTFAGPANYVFGSGASFRSATFLGNGNMNFVSPFMADNLLVGAPNGLVNFLSPVFVSGASPLLPTAPDIELFNIMSTRGLTPPTHGPNVQILGGNGINMMDQFVLGGPDPFIKLFSGSGFNTPGLTTNAPSVLAVFNPINLAAPVFFGDTVQPPPPGAFGLFNSINIQGLPDNAGTTVVIGEKGPALPFLSGDVAIGPDTIDLGDRNMFIISRGAVSGDDLVVTNGIFEIIGVAATNFFQIPVINEFDDVENNEEEGEDEDELPIADGDNGDDGEGNITEESNAESMECAA